jgi:hypothetical protein
LIHRDQSGTLRRESVFDIENDVFTTDSHWAFTNVRPEWTIDHSCLTAHDGSSIDVSQMPFRWLDGAWVADVTVRRSDSGREPLHLRLRISPDTLRRWKDIEINPYLEACAQLRDHIRSARPGSVGTLTLL